MGEYGILHDFLFLQEIDIGLSTSTSKTLTVLCRGKARAVLGVWPGNTVKPPRPEVTVKPLIQTAAGPI